MLNDINSNILSCLRPFFYVAETGSMRRAAALLFQTPSAVSQQIQKLEEALGVPLFERKNGQPLKLLPAGRMLYERIPMLDNTLFRLRSELKTFRDYRLPLRIGAFPLVQRKLLRTAAAFAAQHPRVTFSVTEGHSGTDLCHALIMEELDCVIVFRKHVPQILEKTLLFTSPLVLAVHRSLAEELGDRPAWEQLAALPMINISTNDKPFESNPLAELHITGAIRMQVDSPIAAMDAVRNRLGAAVICEHAVLEAGDGDVVSFPLPGTILRRITLARNPAIRLAPEHEDFLRFLEASWRDERPAPGA